MSGQLLERIRGEQIQTSRADEASTTGFRREDIESLASLKTDVRWIKWVLGIMATLGTALGIAAFFHILHRFGHIDAILLEIVQRLPP